MEARAQQETPPVGESARLVIEFTGAEKVFLRIWQLPCPRRIVPDRLKAFIPWNVDYACRTDDNTAVSVSAPFSIECTYLDGGAADCGSAVIAYDKPLVARASGLDPSTRYTIAVTLAPSMGGLHLYMAELVLWRRRCLDQSCLYWDWYTETYKFHAWLFRPPRGLPRARITRVEYDTPPEPSVKVEGAEPSGITASPYTLPVHVYFEAPGDAVVLACMETRLPAGTPSGLYPGGALELDGKTCIPLRGSAGEAVFTLGLRGAEGEEKARVMVKTVNII